MFFRGFLTALLARTSPKTAAMVRTTTAATVFKGGVKDHILPQHAVATVNHRLLPGDSVAQLATHVRTVARPPVPLRAKPARTALTAARAALRRSATYACRWRSTRTARARASRQARSIPPRPAPPCPAAALPPTPR
mgnify:CR=1 FL=1